MSNDKVKSLFFSQYLGQKVYTCKDWECFNDKSLNEVDPVYLQCGSNRLAQGYLLLRDISQLTDEECVNCSTLLKGVGAHTIHKVVRYGTHIEIRYGKGLGYSTISIPNSKFIIANNDCPDADEVFRPDCIDVLSCYDYLRSIGILLPFTYLMENQPITLTPAEIIALGWAKLQSNEQ